jgi:hypothetical protein
MGDQCREVRPEMPTGSLAPRRPICAPIPSATRLSIKMRALRCSALATHLDHLVTKSLGRPTGHTSRCESISM